MNVDEIEQQARRLPARWAYIRLVETLDKTDNTIKLRLHVETDCFLQVYANVEKGLFSYTLVLNRQRVYGRDTDGGKWHRHPYDNPGGHDYTPEGQKPATLVEFVAEAEQILRLEGLL